MSWLDWLIISLIVIFVFRGFLQGVVWTLVSMLKYLVSFVLILFFGPLVGEFLTKPWNLTQTIALSFRDMVSLPGDLYNRTIEISELSHTLVEGSFPIDEFSSSLRYLVMRLEFTQTLREIIQPLLAQEKLITYLQGTSVELVNYPIVNLEELVFYTVASFIAKLIAISVGALIIMVVVFTIFHFGITLFKHFKPTGSLHIGDRFVGAVFNGSLAFLAMILLLEVFTPILFYLMIDPNQSLMFSVILDTSFHIRPWLERALLNM